LDRVLDYGRTRLAEVEGWLSPLDFAMLTAVLVAQANRETRGDLAEIGVWRGKSAILLSHFVGGDESLYAIDVFDLYYPGEVPSHPRKPYADPADFRRNLEAYGCPRAVTEIASDTRSDSTLVDQLSGRGVRFFHIDGGHSYEHVTADCATALAVVTEDSVVVLDDFMQIDNPAVTEAIIDSFRDAPNGLVPFATTRKKLYLASRAAVGEYWRYLLALLPAAVTRKRPILGASSLILNPPRFDLSRDFQVSLLQTSDVRTAVARGSAGFPHVERWLDESPALNLNA
jgi:hypothetical protein